MVGSDKNWYEISNPTNNAHMIVIVKLKSTAVIDEKGDGTEDNPYKFVESPVGKYVEYDAGDWTEEDLELIKASEGSPKVNNSTDLPTEHGQFGGFTVGQSRNENATSWTHPSTGKVYTPRTDGWRVWDVSKDGQITLIHAGHSETYCHDTTNNSEESLNILRNRDCSMYENEYAERGKARIITGKDAVDWYNKLYGTNLAMEDGGTNTTSTFCGKAFTQLDTISVLETGAWYWLASSWNENSLNIVWSDQRYVWYRADKDSLGVRVMVTLKPGVEIDKSSGDGTENSPYKLVQK